MQKLHQEKLYTNLSLNKPVINISASYFEFKSLKILCSFKIMFTFVLEESTSVLCPLHLWHGKLLFLKILHIIELNLTSIPFLPIPCSCSRNTLIMYFFIITIQKNSLYLQHFLSPYKAIFGLLSTSLFWRHCSILNHLFFSQ